MARTMSDLVKVELHSEAQELARARIDEFAVSLIVEAKRVAFSKGAGIVDRPDVEGAFEAITRPAPRAWRREVVMVLGGIFFGAFVEGLVAQVYVGSADATVMWAVCGIVGAGLIAWGLFSGRA